MSQEVITAIIRFAFILAIPCLVFLSIVVLIRVFRGASSSNEGREKAQCNTTVTRARVVSKRENVVLNPYSTMTFYYIEIEDNLEFRVEKSIYDSVNSNDIVKIIYSAGNLIELYVVESANENTIPKTTYSGHFTDNKK